MHARRESSFWNETNSDWIVLEAGAADGAGELGFFPPYSWWPLWCALTLAVMVYGVAFLAWWLVIIGGALGSLALCGLIFEYYRGDHAH